jgi:hypothetical protein
MFEEDVMSSVVRDFAAPMGHGLRAIPLVASPGNSSVGFIHQPGPQYLTSTRQPNKSIKQTGHQPLLGAQFISSTPQPHNLGHYLPQTRFNARHRIADEEICHYEVPEHESYVHVDAHLGHTGRRTNTANRLNSSASPTTSTPGTHGEKRKRTPSGDVVLFYRALNRTKAKGVRKSGQFTNDELDLAENAIREFMRENGFSEKDRIYDLLQPSPSDRLAKELWAAIYASLPARVANGNRTGLRKVIRRVCREDAEQPQQLSEDIKQRILELGREAEAHAKTPNWAKIQTEHAELQGIHYERLRDYFRAHNLEKRDWSETEELGLITLIVNGENVPKFTQIAKQLGRPEHAVRYKFKQLMKGLRKKTAPIDEFNETEWETEHEAAKAHNN